MISLNWQYPVQLHVADRGIYLGRAIAEIEVLDAADDRRNLPNQLHRTDEWL
jgi:hypothetical protein